MEMNYVICVVEQMSRLRYLSLGICQLFGSVRNVSRLNFAVQFPKLETYLVIDKNRCITLGMDVFIDSVGQQEILKSLMITAKNVAIRSFPNVMPFVLNRLILMSFGLVLACFLKEVLYIIGEGVCSWRNNDGQLGRNNCRMVEHGVSSVWYRLQPGRICGTQARLSCKHDK